MTQKFGGGALLALLIIGGAGPARAQEAFWKRLGDTTLERLAGEVVKSNHDVLAARARLRGARAARLQAALDFAPTVTATASYTRQRLAAAGFPGGFGTAFPDQNVWDAGLQVSWELDVFGRIRKSTQGRGALIGAAEEDEQDLEVLLSAELATAYFDLRGAQDRLQVARRNAENQQHTLDVTLQRLEAGRGNEFDSERARAQLNSTLAAVPELEASIDAVEHRPPPPHSRSFRIPSSYPTPTRWYASGPTYAALSGSSPPAMRSSVRPRQPICPASRWGAGWDTSAAHSTLWETRIRPATPSGR